MKRCLLVLLGDNDLNIIQTSLVKHNYIAKWTAFQDLPLFVFIFSKWHGVWHSQAPTCKCANCHEVPSTANYQKKMYLINSVYPMAQSCKCILLIFNTVRLIVILNYFVHEGRGNIPAYPLLLLNLLAFLKL